MREFFHGWRRKVGCVALVMAVAWMRSQQMRDSLQVRIAEQKGCAHRRSKGHSHQDSIDAPLNADRNFH